MYQNKQSKGSFLFLYSCIAISSIHFFNISLLLIQKGTELFFNHYQDDFSGFSFPAAYSLFKEWRRWAMFMLVNCFPFISSLFANIIEDCEKISTNLESLMHSLRDYIMLWKFMEDCSESWRSSAFFFISSPNSFRNCS